MLIKVGSCYGLKSYIWFACYLVGDTFLTTYPKYKDFVTVVFKSFLLDRFN